MKKTHNNTREKIRIFAAALWNLYYSEGIAVIYVDTNCLLRCRCENRQGMHIKWTKCPTKDSQITLLRIDKNSFIFCAELNTS